MAENLVVRTAKAIYRADLNAHKGASTDYASLVKGERFRYEQMASAALAVALREPVEQVLETVS